LLDWSSRVAAQFTLLLPVVSGTDVELKFTAAR